MRCARDSRARVGRGGAASPPRRRARATWTRTPPANEMRRELSSLLLLLAAAGTIDFDSFFGSQGFQGAQAGGSRGSSGGAADREYYDLLGVEPGCSEADLKKAWRKTSLQSHPDRGGDAEHFKKLNEAYQVLSDPQKRQLYDQYGKAGVEGGAGGMPGGFGGMGGGFGGPGGGFGGFSGMGGQGVDLDDVLNAFFGGGARSGVSSSPSVGGCTHFGGEAYSAAFR